MPFQIEQLKSINFELLHFMRPEYLWSIPLVLLLWFYLKKVSGSSQWERFMPSAMVKALNVNGAQHSSHWRWSLLVLWLLLILGAAGPAWEKQAAPVLENQRAIVLVLDLSPSMLAQDVKPDRLTRAKYKVIDLLRAQVDGQIALVAYAGDAHTVSPLTDDPNTIEALLPALHPNIMPIAGSQAEAASTLALQLLKDAGVATGEIIFVTDGIEPAAIDRIKSNFNFRHELSVLAVGGGQAAPIPKAGGGFMRSSSGEIILASVNRAALGDLATSLNGQYVDLQPDDSDVQQLLQERVELDSELVEGEVNESFDAWADMGYLLALVCLPVMLLLFQRGLVYLLPLAILLPLDVDAAESTKFTWSDIWQTKNQQAAQLYENQEYSAAAETFEDRAWGATAAYQAGDYAAAAAGFASGTDAESYYNMANSLALGGKLKDALAAYDKALELDPDFEDAAYNKAVVEQMSQQQSSSQGNDKQDQQQSSDQDQQSEQQNSEQQNSEQESPKQQESDQDQQANQEQSPADQGQEPSADQEPSAQEEPSAEQEPSANEEPSADEEPSAQEKPSASNEPSDDSPEQESDSEQVTQAAASAEKDPLSDSSEQWLRAIPDDPSGLLRRKFDYQTQLRNRQRVSDQDTDVDPNRY